MAKSVPSHATPSLLRWAREQDGISLETVSLAESVPVERLEAWERGEGTPTLAMLRKLARRYRRPVPVFYLPEPPDPSFPAVRDFRLLPQSVDPTFSTALRRAIRTAQERQYWVSSYLEDEGFSESTIVGSATMKMGVAKVAELVRATLGVRASEQAAQPSDTSAFSFWRRACESAGIFVFQAHLVPIKEMRGCALPDKYAPVILVNSKEDFRPKCFTIIHELVHILLGKAGVSGSGENQFTVAPSVRIERFCNSVAAEVLVPMRDFVARVGPNWQSDERLVLQSLANRYWVTQSVIALRLHEAGLATSGFAEKWLSGATEKPKKDEDETKIPQHRIALSRVGELFSRHAISAFHGGTIHAGELSSILGIKLQFLPKLEETVYPNSVHPFSGNDAS